MQPANVETPELVVTGFVVQERLEPLDDKVMLVLEPNKLELASYALTAGWVVNAVPFVAVLEGWVVKDKLLRAPGLTL